MSKSHVVFFAMPDEQRRWLEHLLADERLWCVIRQSVPNLRLERVNGTDFLSSVELVNGKGNGSIDLFFGCRELVPAPIWLTNPSGHQDLDFARSQAIEYEPSTISGDCVLLSGQLAIMRAADYADRGIDPKPLQQWFKDILKSFFRLKAENATLLIRDPKHDTISELPNDVVTPGVVEWRRGGRLLKQFKDGAYEFDIRIVD